MSIKSKAELEASARAELVQSGIENGKTYARSTIEANYYKPEITLRFHSTPHESMPAIITYINSTSWMVVSQQIQDGYYSHILVVQSR